MTVVRSIKQKGNVYIVTLHIDIKEDAELSAFVLEERYPKGWTVVSSTHNGNFKDAQRIKDNIIEWFGSDFSQLNVEDCQIQYILKKMNKNTDFDGEWITSSLKRGTVFPEESFLW